jgi:hypothetical protein
MILCRFTFFCGLLLLALGLPAAAQQPDIFSKPADGLIEKNAASDQTGSADSVNASPNIFNNRSSSVKFDILPGASAAPQLSGEQAAQWQKFLDGKKNWALMTPAEILGVPTPEKILGIPSKADQEKLTLEERFLQRQENRQTMGATNGFRGNDRGFFGDGNSPFDQSRDDNNYYYQRTDYNRNAAEYDGGNVDPNSIHSLAPRQSPWASAFNFPQPPPKPTPAQLAGMERFRALMEPLTPEPEKTVAPTFTPPVPPQDPYLQRQPDFNPLGRSIARLPSNDNISSHPTGIAPLPSLTRPYAATPIKPAGLAQPPPWLSSSPTSIQFQQRKF